jgi:tRNA dimethylallyltransferase
MLLIITGPTASGKTYLAERIASKARGEIISADSRTIYNDLVIGTGRYSNSSEITYHLIGIIQIGMTFSAYDWVKKARSISEEVLDREGLPIICGGTHHYVELFLKGIDSVPEPDAELRILLKTLAAGKGKVHVHGILRDLDPDLAEKVHPNNLERIVRYIERAGAKREIKAIPPFFEDHVLYFLQPDNKIIAASIERRVDEMIEKGWVDEVRGLMEKGFTPDSPGLDSIGYSDILSHIRGEIDLEEARSGIIAKTIEYSKKQLKWMKRLDPTILEVKGPEDLDKRCEEIVDLIDRYCRSHRCDS